MKSGIELIAEERQEQIEKHGRTVENDVRFNNDQQLSEGASWLCYDEQNCIDKDEVADYRCPIGWDKKLWWKMVEKPYKERLIIAGALIAAEIDRLQAIQK